MGIALDSRLNAFLEKNNKIDFRTADLLHSANLNKYGFNEVETGETESLIEQLKAYQRMLRVVPRDKEELAEKLLKNGIKSALQIASQPKKVFIQKNLETIFDGDVAIAEQVYRRAIAVRKAVALQYIARVQQAEPHARTTGFMR
ncbi:MAG: hypothetical protein F6K21_06800 [Symploca sp. SIO2D2]|nr:hypothetical protein [Symploca sp. SIO2D2]